MTNTSYTYTYPLTKQQIVQRLYDLKQINFEEMITLLEKETIYVPPFIPDQPQFPPNGPYWITSNQPQQPYTFTVTPNHNNVNCNND